MAYLHAKYLSIIDISLTRNSERGRVVPSMFIVAWSFPPSPINHFEELLTNSYDNLFPDQRSCTNTKCCCQHIPKNDIQPTMTFYQLAFSKLASQLTQPSNGNNMKTSNVQSIILKASKCYFIRHKVGDVDSLLFLQAQQNQFQF